MRCDPGDDEQQSRGLDGRWDLHENRDPDTEINPRARIDARRDHRIRPNPRQIADVAKLARDTPEVVECHRVTGEDCFVMTAFVRDVEHLEAVIDQFVAYGQATSSIMQSAPVPRRGVTLGPDAQPLASTTW